MTAGMDHIKIYFSEFCQSVDDYQENMNNPDRHRKSCIDAYEALYRLNKRIYHEVYKKKPIVLEDNELAFCHGFLNDRFLNGLLPLRTVATHVVSDTAKKVGHIFVTSPDGFEITLDAEMSAAAAFSDDILDLPNHPYGFKVFSHLEYLKKAISRINRLMKQFHITK